MSAVRLWCLFAGHGLDSANGCCACGCSEAVSNTLLYSLLAFTQLVKEPLDQQFLASLFVMRRSKGGCYRCRGYSCCCKLLTVVMAVVTIALLTAGILLFPQIPQYSQVRYRALVRETVYCPVGSSRIAA